MLDRDTGRARGFGFVTFRNEQEAQVAVDGLNEQELDGRRIKVNPANARRGGGDGRGGFGGGFLKLQYPNRATNDSKVRNHQGAPRTRGWIYGHKIMVDETISGIMTPVQTFNLVTADNLSPDILNVNMGPGT